MKRLLNKEKRYRLLCLLLTVSLLPFLFASPVYATNNGGTNNSNSGDDDYSWYNPDSGDPTKNGSLLSPGEREKANEAIKADTPFEILNDKGKVSIGQLRVGGDLAGGVSVETYLSDQTGVRLIGYILTYAAVISAIILIVSALVMLIIVNYPKTVAQTKQKIGQVFLTIIVVAMLPILFDVLYTLVHMLMGYSS